MPLLTIKDLNVSIHGTPILNKVTTSIDAGQVLGVIGESGSGKSMTALAVMGLLPAGSRLDGSIEFDSQSLTSLSETELCAIRGDDIGMV